MIELKDYWKNTVHDRLTYRSCLFSATSILDVSDTAIILLVLFSSGLFDALSPSLTFSLDDERPLLSIS